MEENPAEKPFDRFARCGWDISSLRASPGLSLVIYDDLTGRSSGIDATMRRQTKGKKTDNPRRCSLVSDSPSFVNETAVCHCIASVTILSRIILPFLFFAHHTGWQKDSASLECQSGLTEFPVFHPFLPDTSACPQSILGSAQLNLSWPLKASPNIKSKLGLWSCEHILVKPWEGVWVSRLPTSAHHTVVPETSEAMLRWCFHAGAILRLFFSAEAILRLFFLL